MEDNTKSNERSVTEPEATIDVKKNSNLIPNTHEARRVPKKTSDRTAVQMAIWKAYVLLFLYQKQLCYFLLENVAFGQYPMKLLLFLQLVCL